MPERALFVAAASSLLTAGSATGQVLTIPPDTLPGEAYFSVNPGATVNVESGGAIAPESDDPGAFDFNGATVNINSGADCGFFTFDTFMENMTFSVNTGGELIRTKIVGSVGSTNLNVSGGDAGRGLWLQGNTVGTMTSGTIGDVAQGQAALIVEDTASFSMSGGTIDTFILFNDATVFNMTGGTIEGGFQLNDTAVANVEAGSILGVGSINDVGCILNLSGGTIGSDFMAIKGVVNMSGGAMGTNSTILNSSGVDPVFNMTGGALGSDFRAYDGTFNLSGGLVGDRFKLGRPTGDGSGVTLNITCKSATLDAVPLMLSTMPTTITARGGLVLTCVLLDDSIISLDLNEVFVLGEDRVRAAATLTVALPEPCVGDIADDFGTLGGDGEVGFGDFLALLALTGPCGGGTSNPDCIGDIADDLGSLGGDGMVSFGDFLALLALTGDCP